MLGSRSNASSRARSNGKSRVDRSALRCNFSRGQGSAARILPGRAPRAADRLARAAHQPHRDTDVEADAEPAAHRHSTALLHPERPWDDDGGRPDRLSEPLDDQRVTAGDRRAHQPEEEPDLGRAREPAEHVPASGADEGRALAAVEGGEAGVPRDRPVLELGEAAPRKDPAQHPRP